MGREPQSGWSVRHAVFAVDEGAFVHFLCSRPGGDVVSNFRPLLPQLSAAAPGRLLASREGVSSLAIGCGRLQAVLTIRVRADMTLA